MIVTTAGRTNEEWTNIAKVVAKDLQCSFQKRNKQSVKAMIERFQDDVLVIGKQRFELYNRDHTEPFFFHPNMAVVRIKRLMQGEVDPMLDAMGLSSGMSLLDCTMGLGSDSIVASYIVGNAGHVSAVEANPFMAYLVNWGLKTWDSEGIQLADSMKRIRVVDANHYDFLKEQEDNSFDVVYFDPMFNETIQESKGIRPLTGWAEFIDLTPESIHEALRVAKVRVVLKDHYQSPRFKRHGFQQIIRKTALFHYGFINVKESH
ncbi:class I SAM-dependent methyltransferase [Peribacillus alkalitolerans]|uniref:class I SAM-dependent methyltransferase n=1 Tax=Peribacillus alkalitolerans TaxID=1550385 RepID=UPI0013D8CE03|nr:class I SAM-dependent methyltransferase [Peribacillus alkalitolerans]